MVAVENIKIGLDSLRGNPMRSILTLIGIAVGIAAVLYVVVLGEITQRNIKKRLEALGSNVIIIRPGMGHFRGVRTAGSTQNLKVSDAKDILDYSKVIIRAVPIYSSSASLEFEDKNSNNRVSGVTPDYAIVDNSFPTQGRFFTEAETNQRARVCVLGSQVTQDLFGDESPIGESVLINSSRFEVIGVLPPKGESWSSPDDQVFVPLTTAQERLFGTDHISSIDAQLDKASSYDEALFDVETVLRRNHRLRTDQENDFRVFRQDMFLSTIQETNTELANFIILIALVSLVVGGIGIANVMLVSVTERTREIGIRRAVGASRTMIIIQFLMEAMVLGMVGGLLGLIIGTAFNRLFIANELILPWLWIGNSIMICTIIGLLAGLYPALRAARTNVIDALRYE